MNNKYKNVFTPVQHGPIRLKNKIVGLPMMSSLSTSEGRVTDALVAHMASRAKTGMGLVIIGDSAIDYDNAVTHVSPLDLSDEKNFEGLVRIAEEVHRYGAKIGIELQHGGAMSCESFNKKGVRVSPMVSPASGPRFTKDSVAMDKALMDEVKENYCKAAVRLMRAGFDLLLVHSGHGWLLSQFLSARLNQRTDEYGGCLENRMRYPLEVLKAIKERVGHKMAIDIRVSVGGPLWEHSEQELEETIVYLRAASAYIDGANISVSTCEHFPTSEYMCQSYYLPHMVNTSWCERIKKAGVPIPVTATGSIVTVAEAEQILATGKADLVGMGRGSLVDNLHVTKVFRGQEDEVRPCLRCAHCTDRIAHNTPIRCAINPMLGRELYYPILAPVLKKKKVIVVGGGPAGMQAAQTAALRGCDVVLYEKSSQLGGLLHVAGALPDKYDMRRYTDWMIKQTEKCGASIVLNTEVTPKIIRSEAPDTVFLAIGSIPLSPPIPGLSGDTVVLVNDVDTGTVKTGGKVVILGAGFSGCECAIPLLREGKSVTIIDMISEAVFDANTFGSQSWISITRILNDLGVQYIFDATVTSVTPEGINYSKADGTTAFLEADTVINALGLTVDYGKVDELIGIIPETYTIGDCLGDKMNIDNAIYTGFVYATEI